MTAFMVMMVFMLVAMLFVFTVAVIPLANRLGIGVVAAADCRTRRTAYRAAYDCAIFATRVMPHRRARSAAQSPAQYGTQVCRLDLRTCGQQQGQYQRFFHDDSCE